MKLRYIFICVFIHILSHSQSVFDTGIRTIEIFFSEPNWNDTLDLYYMNNLDQRLLADSILIDGIADQDVGVKYKGSALFNLNHNKRPLNLKLDYINNGQSIDGYNVLKLSNGFSDPSLVREILGYEIAREYMPAPQAAYASVYINSVWYGIYVLVQSIDNDFTNENFYERKGPFFKAQNNSIQISGCNNNPLGIWQFYSDSNCYARPYEMISSNDWTDLQNFTDTFNNHFLHVENILDIDRTLWMMAFLNLTVSLDGPINSIPHNFYMFKDNNSRFSPVLWDLNQSFGTFTSGFPNPVNITMLQELDVFHESTNQENKMCNKIFSNDRYKRMYIAHMKTIINEQFSSNNYLIKSQQFQNIIDSLVFLDPNLFYSYSDFSSNINNTVSSGNNSVYGISELMADRINFVQSLPEYNAIAPTISVLNSGSELPHSSFYITADIQNADYVYLGYRFKFSDKFEKIEMYDDGNHGDLNSNDGIYGIGVSVDARDIQYYIYAENNDAGIFSPERAEKEFYQIPIVSGLVINEIMASNLSSVNDQSGEYDDWVELYNGGNSSINLDGFYLSDNENDLYKWSFPNVTINPDDYLIIWCDTAGSSQSGLHTTYRLSADQEEVYLTDPSGLVIDTVHFVNMPQDISYSRIPNGVGVFDYQNHTFGFENTILSFEYEFEENKKMRVYPNPTNDRIYVLDAFGDHITIYNSLGQQILKTPRVSSISIKGFNQGVYYIKSGNSVSRIIKK